MHGYGVSNDEQFDVEKFNTVYHASHNNDLKIFHLNIRSLAHNGDNLLCYLSLLKQSFDVICLTETWLNENRFIENTFLEYNQFHSRRSANQAPGGGCAIFVKKSFISSELSHLSCNLNHIECVFIEIIHQNGKIFIGCCYRKPDHMNSPFFIDDLTQKINQIPNTNPIVLGGDFNYNLERVDTDMNASSFFEAMLSLGLVNTIYNPTRVTNNSCSVIDNIFVSISLSYSSGVLSDCDISDHYALFIFLKNILSSSRNDNVISYRLINESSIENFCNSISIVDFTHVLQTDNIDFAIEELDAIILDHFNLNCPVVTKNISKKDREKPWISPNMKRLISMRQRYSMMRKINLISFECYKGIRNFVTTKLREAK